MWPLPPISTHPRFLGSGATTFSLGTSATLSKLPVPFTLPLYKVNLFYCLTWTKKKFAEDEWYIHQNVISHIWLFNKNGHSPGLHKLWFSWLGKRLFEMCWFYIGIAQIDLDPPSLLSNRQTWKRSAPNHPGKPLHPASFGQWTMHFCCRKAKNSCCSENLDLQHFCREKHNIRILRIRF